MSELQYEDSESDESEEDAVDDEDPLWALYSHVRNYETPSGLKLYEPFLTLPSKRELPDYYEVIDEPISLNQIRKKLKAGDYIELPDLAVDLNLMFENCKTYNRPDSRLYKEGVKLQKIMNAKLEELDMDEDEINERRAAEAEKSPVRSPGPKDPMKKRMQTLYNSVLNYTNRDNVNLIGMFMQKPSRKDYPDYYEVISKPIDMTMIQDKIRHGTYRSEDELISDMKLMFSNCRQYNEEGSSIYEDAIVLEKVLINKGKDMGLIQVSGRGRPKTSKGGGGGGAGGAFKGASVVTTSTAEKVKTLYDSLKDHKDTKGRQLSLIFLKLPHPKEFPDYFEVIKNPIDFEKIGSKIKQNVYVTIDDCLADFILMFDNACKYNEPDSQIYKDALTLQSLASRTCRSLQDDDSSCPDVQAAVQEILNYIFISMYNHQDAEDRCFSDSLAELPEHDDVNGKSVRALSLDLIKRRLDRGLYKRLDTFQRDVFVVLERARNLSKSDSQVFEDAVELQTHFINIRDNACANGDILQSRALLFTEADLSKAVESSKDSKPPSDGNDDDSQDAANVSGVVQGADGTTSSVTFGQQQYTIGDFVYVETADKAVASSIFLIERIFTKMGEQMMYGNQFFRPVETYHVSTRKFLENEVFRTENHQSVAMSKIVGRCCVVPVREYFKQRPEGFENKDLYVCESRYSNRSRSFKKMKIFWNIPEHIKMVNRDEVLEPKRVMSVFKERIERHKEELEEIEAMVNTVEGELPPNVLWMNAENAQPGCIYYEQYTIPGPITLRRGDHVYVRSENGKNLIAQIDSMWRAEAE